MNRKIVVILTIIIAGFIISLSYTFMVLQDLHILRNDNAQLRNENAELQDCLNALPIIKPFIQIGRDYLDGLNKTTGKILSIQLEEKAPIYAHPYKPSAEEFRLCWVIRFEQAKLPGHFFEVWIDASTSEIVGMTQCRASYVV